ncbi:MAG TPA: ABC transporter permease [Streptosporangiaceae bacterium]|nr:ABC transporter permease [Streptosporangiaceae bacterium]
MAVKPASGADVSVAVAAGDVVPPPRKKAGGKSRRRLTLIGLQALAVLVILALWQVLSGRVIATFLISDPIDVVKKLVGIIQTATMWTDISVTAQELVVGYAIGVAGGAVVGWALGMYRLSGSVFEPIINAVNGIPKIALAPVFLLWFGLGIWSKVAQASMIVFFVMFYNVYMGMRNAPEPLVNVVSVIGGSRIYILRKVIFPSLAVPIFAGLKAGVPFAMIGVIVGEFVAADKGVGYYALEATQQYDAAGLFASLVIMVVMVLIGLAIVNIFQRRALRWQQG